MILIAYKNRDTHSLSAADVALFKSGDKYVTAVMPDGTEWLLSGYITLKMIEAEVPGLTRISRGVLVRSDCILGCMRSQIGANYANSVETPVGVYQVARRVRITPLRELVKQNRAVPQ